MKKKTKLLIMLNVTISLIHLRKNWPCCQRTNDHFWCWGRVDM